MSNTFQSQNSHNIRQLSLNSLFCQSFLTTREAAWCIILVVSVSLYMYVCQKITYETLNIRSSYLYTWYISTGYELSLHIKVIGSQEPKRSKITILIQCKTSIGNNSSSVKHTAVMFACSMGFSGMANGML